MFLLYHPQNFKFNDTWVVEATENIFYLYFPFLLWIIHVF